MTPSELIGSIILLVVTAGLVYWDAKRQGDKNPGVWGVAVFGVAIVVLPIYLISRALGWIGPACPKCGKCLNREIAKGAATCTRCGAPVIHVVDSQEILRQQPAKTISEPAKPTSKDETSARKFKRRTSVVTVSEPVEKEEAVPVEKINGQAPVPRLQVGTKFCRYCGAKILRGSKFCEECGSELVE